MQSTLPICRLTRARWRWRLERRRQLRHRAKIIRRERQQERMGRKERKCIYVLARLFINSLSRSLSLLLSVCATSKYFIKFQVRGVCLLHNKSSPHSNAICKWMSKSMHLVCYFFLGVQRKTIKKKKKQIKYKNRKGNLKRTCDRQLKWEKPF